jgi:hypothetical protein
VTGRKIRRQAVSADALDNPRAAAEVMRWMRDAAGRELGGAATLSNRIFRPQGIDYVAGQDLGGGYVAESDSRPYYELTWVAAD